MQTAVVVTRTSVGTEEGREEARPWSRVAGRAGVAC